MANTAILRPPPETIADELESFAETFVARRIHGEPQYLSEVSEELSEYLADCCLDWLEIRGSQKECDVPS